MVDAAALLDNAARAPDATLPEIMARREVRSDDELAPSHRNSWLALVIAAREYLGRPEVRRLGGSAEVTSRLRRLIAYGECLHEIVLTEELYVTRDLGVLLERVCQPLDRLLVAQRRSCAAQLGVGACFCCHVGAAARDNALLPWTRQVGALSLLHTALVDEWAQRRRNPTGSFSGGGGGVTAACVCAALSKKLPFLERVYREALRHSRGPPPIEAVSTSCAPQPQVAQILDLVEHAHVLVHGSRSAIAPTIYDSQPVQRSSTRRAASSTTRSSSASSSARCRRRTRRAPTCASWRRRWSASRRASTIRSTPSSASARRRVPLPR